MRRYGQNHLVDKNILHAIVDQAAGRPRRRRPRGRGRRRAAHAAHARARARWSTPSRSTAAGCRGSQELAATDPRLVLHAGDALKADLGALDPPPTAIVANLAYNIAIPLIMTTISGLPSVRRWSVMVQRELGERLFASPSTKAYAAVSVLTQLACRLEKSRPVPASAFRPQPRVESSFISFARRGDDDAPGAGEYAAVSHLVRLAFGQRRKTLVNSLGGAAHAGATISRDDVREGLRALALSEAARPEELTPPQWRTFAAELGGPAAGGPAA